MQQMSTRQFVVGAALSACISVAVFAHVHPGLTWENTWAAGFFALIGLMAQALGHRLPRGVTGSIAFIPFLSALAVAPGLPLVATVALAVLCAEIIQRRETLKAAFNVSQYVLAICVAILTYVSLGGHELSGSVAIPLPAFIAAFAAFLFTNTVAVAWVISVSQKRRVMQVWRQATYGTFVYDFFALPVVYLFAYVYANPRLGPWWASGLAIPLFGLRQLYKTNRQLDTINEELLQLMVAAIEARDPYTSGHSQRVAEYSRVVSHVAGLRSRAAERVYTAALLHDVGKIHEEFAAILRKPGRLNDVEYTIMKTHTAKGAALVAKVTQFRDLIQPIRGHHEAWDGHGYPDGLVGAEIPLYARVIAFADTIDAMTTDRPYRRALAADAVRTEIQAQAGRQFDPDVAAALISEKHWSRMAEAIQRGGATRRPTPISIGAVPRHSASRRTVRPT